MLAVWIVLGVMLFALLVTIFYVIAVYNGLVHLKNSIDKDWSNIDVLLKQRFDELPKLIKVCEGYMQHEKGTLEAVIKAKPASCKGRYLMSATISSTMGPGVKLDAIALAKEWS